MRRCVIISNGMTELDSFDFCEDDFIICADGGFRYANKFKITPSLIVGDFDSINQQRPDIPAVRYPKEKDVTDTMIAVSEGLLRGCDEFVFLCALGGRLDHTFAVIQNVAELAEHGMKAQIIDKNNEAMVICGEKELTINKRDGYKFSIFSLTPFCEGITLTGFKYPLNNYKLSSLIPLGISNEFVDDCASVKIKSGRLLIILSKDSPL